MVPWLYTFVKIQQIDKYLKLANVIVYKLYLKKLIF